uniref:RNA ligase domain-containing protein n=1 Tax=Clytia hemisphaerica TaxID=252671 RepID=A0A7M5USC7_9CNID
MASNKEKMKFIEYEKMQNSFSRLIVTKEMEKAEWTVTEKIHGANFSFHINKDEVKVARRRDFLNENENFFNHLDAEFMRTYPEKMRQVFEDVVKRYTDKQIKHITVWGEIFGGLYEVDGETLKGAKKCSPVQLEVLYTPNIEWVAYDISYKTTDSKTTEQEYLDYEVALEIFKTNEIFHLKPLFVGRINEVFDYNLRFDSTLPKILGYPELPKGSNIVEGVVAKQMKNLKFKKGGGRAIVKLKNPEFAETILPVPKAKGWRSAVSPRRLVALISAPLSNKILAIFMVTGFRYLITQKNKGVAPNMSLALTLAPSSINFAAHCKCFGCFDRSTNFVFALYWRPVSSRVVEAPLIT